VLAGPVDEEVKWGLLAGADLLVSPSAYESLSLVVLEAWAAGTPVLVNGLCGPTRRHCLRSGGGLWYEGYAGFEAALDRLLASASLRDRLARAGAAYVAAHFRWPIVLDRYTHFLARVGGSAA
jgi:glycosyltransferase involved in cell wall biosynthesis